MPANFGLLPELVNKVPNKQDRYKEYRDRALSQVKRLTETLFDKTSSYTTT